MSTQSSLKFLVLALAALPYAVYAEDVATTEQNVELKTVDVTAQNRSTRTENKDSYTTSAMRTTTGLALSPKETPQSVSVITKTQLNEQAITSMEGAMKTTTGVNVVPDSGRWRYQSRGFYIDQIEEDGVSSTVVGSSGNPYRDGQSMTDLAIYDHIEVVRGATGLTQANGEPGGTINAVRKRPTAQTQFEGELSINRWGNVRGVADVSGSMNEAKTLRGRLVGVAEKTESFKKNVEGANTLIYGVTEADVGENTKLTTGVMYQHRKDTLDYFGLPMGVGGADLKLPYDTYLGANWNEAIFKKLNLFGEVEHYFNDDWKLVGRLNYFKNKSDSQFAGLIGKSAGLSGTAATVNNMQNYVNDGDQITANLNLNGKYELLGRRHDLFAGYGYSHEQTDTRWRRVRNSSAYNIYDFNGQIPQPNWETAYSDQTFYNMVLSSHAWTLGTRFNLTDKLHMIAGTRYTRWRRHSFTDYNWWNGKADSDADEYSSNRRNRFIPYFGLTWDITPNHSLYASYTSIFKPQSGKDYNNRVLEPVLGSNYEMGWKTEWFNRKLNTSVALFQIDQKNRAVWIDDSSHENDGFYMPIGRVRSRGIDTEVSGNLTDSWKIFAGYTINNSKYLERESSSYTAGMNFSKHTPKHMFRLYTSYRLGGIASKWSVGGGMSVQSDTSSLQNVAQGGYTLWNANIQYEPNQNFKLALIGSNLTDKRYYLNHRTRTNAMNNLYGEPRNITLKLNYKF